MNLRTGTELILLTVVINKISGLYGLLALLTGVHLSPLQLTMYIYSLVALGLVAYLAPHVRKQSPLQCLALAYFYAVDSVINAAYTAAFGVGWFLVLADGHSTGAAGGTTKDAGFANPKYNVSQVEVVAEPAPGLVTGQDAVAVGSGASDSPSGIGTGFGTAVLQSGSMTSISIICCLWILRGYFVIVMLAYARQVLRQHIYTTSTANFELHTGAGSAVLAENPFAEGKSEGQGWQGQLGRLMVSIGKQYWLGADEEGEWTRGMGGKFGKKMSLEPVGVQERERRRRSGTGPPPPPQAPEFVCLKETK